MNEFIKALDELNAYCKAHPETVTKRKQAKKPIPKKLDELIDEAVSLFEKYMITEKGNPDTIGMMHLEDNTAYSVRAGETDACGWLSAVVTLPYIEIVIV